MDEATRDTATYLQGDVGNCQLTVRERVERVAGQGRRKTVFPFCQWIQTPGFKVV